MYLANSSWRDFLVHLHPSGERYAHLLTLPTPRLYKIACSEWATHPTKNTYARMDLAIKSQQGVLSHRVYHCIPLL